MPVTERTAEHRRLEENRKRTVDWLAWGPYLSERQWGTVREDYSAGGDAWNYFPHDHARSRAYRWGEDGIAGISDAKPASLLLARPLERRRSDPQGAHVRADQRSGQPRRGRQGVLVLPGQHPDALLHEDALQVSAGRVPLRRSGRTNGRRSKDEFEYELLDTGIFDESRYFDVFVEYAKAAHDDILVEITAHNRGPEPATLWLLPTLWFRNTWATGPGVSRVPSLDLLGASGPPTVRASHPDLGEWRMSCEQSAELLFCDNETNSARVFGSPNTAKHVKDGINDYVVDGDADAVNPAHVGTKAAALHKLEVEPGASARIRVRLATGQTGSKSDGSDPLGTGFDKVMDARRKEADDFYATVIPAAVDADAANVMRQSLAGMLWGKQYFEYDVHTWLREHGVNPWSVHASSRTYATRPGSTSRPGTSSRCRTSGSTRGLRPGTSRCRRSRSRSSTSTSPRIRWSSC